MIGDDTGLNLSFGLQPTVSDQKKQNLAIADVKKETLVNKAAEKQINLGGMTQQDYLLDEARRREGFAQQRPEAAVPMSDEDLRASVKAVQARNEFDRLQDVERTAGGVIKDTAAGVIGGVGSAVGGLASLNNLAMDAMGIGDTPLNIGGRAAEAAGSWLAEESKKFYSNNLNDIQQLSGLEKAVRAEDSKATYEADIANGRNPTVAGLARVGRDALSGAEALIDNPATITNALAENAANLVGSSVGGAALATGLVRRQLLSRGATTEAAERFLNTARGQSLVRATSVSMQPLLSGAQEAGGAAMQAGQEIDKMSFDDLQKNSAEYRELIKTHTPEEAKELIKFNVVSRSAAAAGATGVVMGNLTKTFDAAPLAATGLGSIVKNAAGEAVEEGVQGGVGQIAQNQAIKDAADNTKDVLEGVGESIGEGAVVGAAMVGAAQGPGQLAATSIDAAKMTGQAAKAGAEKVVKANNNRINNQINEDNAVTPETVEAAQKQADTVVEALAQPSEDGTVDPNKQSIVDNYRISDDELANNISDRTKALVGDENGEIPRERTKFVNAIAQKFAAEDTSPEDKAHLAADLINEVESLNLMFNDDTFNYVSSLDKEDETVSQFTELARFVTQTANTAEVKSARDFLIQQKIDEANLTEETAATPEGAEQAQMAAAVAMVAPQNVSPEASKQVLDLVRKRIIQLPERSVKALELSENISKLAKLYSDEVAELPDNTGKTRTGKSAETVTDEIVKLGWSTDEGSDSKKLSIIDHASTIRQLATTGQANLAKDQLEDFTNFTLGQVSKIKAFDESSKTGKKIPYEFYSPAQKAFFSSTTRKDPGMQLHAGNQNSINLYKRTFAETSAAVAMQNVLANTFPELGIKPLEMPHASISIARRQGILSRNLEALASFQPGARTETPLQAPIEPKVTQEPAAEPLDVASEPLVQEVPKRDMESRFGKLGNGRFNEVFNDDEKSTSIIKDDLEPIKTVTNAVKNNTINSKLLSKAPNISKRLGERLSAAVKERGVSTAKAIDETMYRGITFSNIDENDNVQLDKQVSDIAAISGMSGLLRMTSAPKLSSEDLMEKLGIDSAEFNSVSEDNFFTDYTPTFQIVDNIARNIMSNLGISAKSNVGEHSSYGAVQGLAQETVASMIEDGILIKKNVDINNKTFSGVKINPEFLNNEDIKSLVKDMDAINEVVNPEGEKNFYTSAPPTDAQLRMNQKGTGLGLSRKQKDAIRFQSNIKFQPNIPFLEIVDALGEDTLKKIRGFVEITDEMREKMNVNDLKSIEGKNKSIETEISDTFAALDRMGRGAVGNDTLGEEAIYFAHEVTKVNRMQMTGPANPQSNKFARAALRSTWATLDMNNPDHVEGFWRTVLQMSGVKIGSGSDAKKIEYLSTDQILNGAESAINDKYGSVIAELEKFYSNKPINTSVIEQGLAGTEPVVLESLSAIARLNIASDKEKKAFRHSVPLEADGVTNGPAAVLMKFATGAFTEEQLAQYERIGFFLGSKDNPRSLDTKEVDGDTYGVTSKRAEVKIQKRQEDLKKNYAATVASVNKFMQIFAPKGITIEDGVDGAVSAMWSLTRDAAKNPLTKTTYGAGKLGTARGIAKDAVSKFYAELSKASMNGLSSKEFAKSIGLSTEDFKNIMETLFTYSVSVNDKGEFYINNANSIDYNDVFTSGNLSKLTITPEGMENFVNNLNTVYVDPLFEAVKDTMGSSFETMQLVIKAAQVQAAVLRQLFTKFEDRYNTKEIFSPKEFKQWQEEFKRLGAFIETDGQSFFIGMKGEKTSQYTDKKGNRQVRKVSRSTKDANGQIAEAYRTTAPQFAGVSAAAYINIGTGDGLMMTEAMANYVDGLENTLQIFDGMEMAADKIKSVGPHMNKAAFKAWNATTIEDVANSFENFARNFSKSLIANENFNDADAEAVLAESIRDKKDKRSLSQLITDILEGYQPPGKPYVKGLRQTVTEIKARREVLAQVSTWTDQMAGAGTPYHNAGQVLEGDKVQQAAALNSMLSEKIKHNKEAGLRQAEANQALTAKVLEVSEDLGDGIKTIPLAQLSSLVKSMGKQSRDFYRDVLRDSIPEGLQVFYGPAESLQTMRDTLYPDESGTASSLLDVSGQYDRNHNVLFLVESPDNRIGETILHELTHVSIADKIDAYFNDIGPGNVNNQLRDAVSRLTALADDFLNLNFSNDGKRVQDAVKRLRDMREGRGLDSTVVNETIAEILTNPDLIAVAKQQKSGNKFLQVFRSILDQLKKLIPGLRNAGNTYFSNAAFNAQIISKLPLGPVDPSDTSTRYNQVLNKLSPSGSKTKEASQQIKESVTKSLNTLGLGNTELIQKYSDTFEDIAISNLATFANAGFEFNVEEAITFKSLMTLFASDAKISGPALVRAQDIYDEVMKDLAITDFEGTYTEAKAKMDALLGKNQKLKDASGNSLALARFLALASSNKEFGALLDKKAAPKAEKLTWEGADDTLSSITQIALDNLTNLIVGENKGYTANEAIQNVIGKLANFEAEKQTKAEELYQNTYGYLDEKAAGYLDRGATALAQKMDKWRKTMSNPLARAPLWAAQAAVSAFSKKEGAHTRDTITTKLNQAPVPYAVIELGAEIFGRYDANKNIYDMVNRNRFESASIRQEFREQYPVLIQEKFKRTLSKAEWKAMFVGLGQTDIAALSGYKSSVLAQFFTNKTSRDKEVAKLSNGLTTEQINQANALADYMVNRKTSHMLRRNAEAIAVMSTGSNVDNIDKLVSILAIDKMDNDMRKTMSELMIKERSGIEFTIALMTHTAELEKAKFNDPMVKMNQWKGYIPQQDAPGTSVIIADNSDHKKLVLMGYERVGAYGGQSADYQGSNMSYYRSTTSSKNPYTQGAALTVQNSQNGIDIRTGRSVTGQVSGTITGPYVQSILARMQNQPHATQGEHLLPVYAADGVRVIGFERAMKPEMLALKKPDMHLGNALGIMAGRQIEEDKARKFNLELAKEVIRVYNEDSLRHDEYINLATSTDPVHKDTWDNVIPHDMKMDLMEASGKADFFPIRKDMIPMVVGYRNAGVTDLWTGVSRIPKPVLNAMKDMVIKLFGRKAYSYLYNAEKFWTTVVSEAKVLIVVKSVVVPAFNFMSNIMQLLSIGVPLRSITTLGVKKFVEINKYAENQKKGMRLSALMKAEKNPLIKAKLKNQIDALKAVDRKLSIWPLIERGEFNTITEGLTDIDVSLADGKFSDWVEAQVEKLPEGIRTAGRYAVVSRSTSLYKGLNIAVQYGDFLAKAILYDDMVNRQNKTKADALGFITEAFVNYNIPAGRSRTFMEAFGLAWFHNFKIRSLKFAHYSITNNPLRALMNTMMVSQVSSLGSPITDNVLAAGLDGRLANSFGLGTMFRAPELNPWFALTR